jgi:SAM-dependent methyltransferase
VGSNGRVDGIDPADSAIEIARRRCSDLTNVNFQPGDAAKLPFGDSIFDAAMSSQVFEYLDDVPAALAEMFRILKPGGRLLIHDTDWGATLWRSSDEERMARIMSVWDGHLANPHLPQTLGQSLATAGFGKVRAEAIVQLELDYDPGSVSAILMKAVGGYATSNGISRGEADAWAKDLRELGSRGGYFFSSNEYIVTGLKP